MPADKNNIAFTFSALNYAVVNTDIYEYFLEGYDKEWLTLMKGNQVAYMNLPVGNYVLKYGRRLIRVQLWRLRWKLYGDFLSPYGWWYFVF